MKKSITRLSLLFAALMLVSATAIAETFNPSLKKGDVATYRNTTTQIFEVVPGSKTYSAQISELTVAVEKENKVGPVVTVTTNDFTFDVTGYMAETVKKMLPATMADYLKGNVVELQYDRHGNAIDVLNFDSIVARTRAYVDNCPPMLRPGIESTLNVFMQKDMLIRNYNTIGAIFGLSGLDIKEGASFETNVPGMGNMPIICSKIEKSHESATIDFQSGTVTDFPELYNATRQAAMQQLGYTTVTPEMEAQIDAQVKKIFENLKLKSTISYELFKNRWPEKIVQKTAIAGSPSKLTGVDVEIICLSHKLK